ncbi:MAG: alpha/beta hydrolase [Acidobacteriia bacterium]|nr:alpha/beta hydrolase [Terriglobia bacterium]
MRIDRSKNINSSSITRVLVAEIVVLAFSAASSAQVPRQVRPTLDDDSGGAISKGEASDEMSLNFSIIDANRDGALNLDELERALELVRSQQGESSPGNKSTEAITETPAGTGVFERVEHHETDNDGVPLHYVTLGKGPVILFVHGFPDFWFTWRQQMAALSGEYKTVAMDMRAYNKSGKPEGVEHYTMPHLLADVEAVIKDLQVDSVTLVGHDWGGAISWQFAMRYPHRVNKLVICNLTHPRGYATVRRNATAEQKANTQYINDFQTPGFEKRFTPETLARISLGDVSGVVWEHYVDAFAQSSIKGMLDYYRAAYPGLNSEAGWGANLPILTMPVLQFHGLKDKAVDKDGLRDTWNWIDENYTLVTIPTSGHWVQRDAADIVSDTMRWWLKSRPSHPVSAEAPSAP